MRSEQRRPLRQIGWIMKMRCHHKGGGHFHKGGASGKQGTFDFLLLSEATFRNFFVLGTCCTGTSLYWNNFSALSKTIFTGCSSSTVSTTSCFTYLLMVLWNIVPFMSNSSVSSTSDLSRGGTMQWQKTKLSFPTNKLILSSSVGSHILSLDACTTRIAAALSIDLWELITPSFL